MSFFENDLLQSGNRDKKEGAPKEKCNRPLSQCVRGSVLWVHTNKEGVTSFQVPGCVCLFVTSVAFLNHTNNRFDQPTRETMGLAYSGFHLEKISLRLGVCDVEKWSSVYCCVTTLKLSGITQQLFFCSQMYSLGRTWQDGLISAPQESSWIYQVGQENSLPTWLTTWLASWCWLVAWGSTRGLSL